MDEKSGKNPVKKAIFTAMEKHVYVDKMRQLFANLVYKHPKNLNLKNVARVCEELKRICLDVKKHQLVQVKNIPLWPKTYISPMQVEKHFSEMNVNEVTLAELKKFLIF